ncbi:hypothetical protein GCM10010381_54860 [Streptomyces xantholiticus]|nr:hypothetical protein GCM10010381_54860 [Streptomyces xantholiticus]
MSHQQRECIVPVPTATVDRSFGDLATVVLVVLLDFDHPRNWLRRRRIAPRIAPRGIEPSNRLGRHRWVVERSMCRLNGCRRLHRRYERKAEHFLAFVRIAGSLIRYRRCTNWDGVPVLMRRPSGGRCAPARVRRRWLPVPRARPGRLGARPREPAGDVGFAQLATGNELSEGDGDVERAVVLVRAGACDPLHFATDRGP